MSRVGKKPIPVPKGVKISIGEQLEVEGPKGKLAVPIPAGVRIEQHWNQDDDIAQKNGEERLFPIHAAGNHRARHQVGRNVDAHGDPERRVVVGAPRAVIEGNRREIFVPQRAGCNARSNAGGCVSGYVFGHRVVTFRSARDSRRLYLWQQSRASPFLRFAQDDDD